MKTKRAYFATAACAALTVFSAGCSPEWITGGAPDVPEGAFIEDKENIVAPVNDEPAEAFETVAVTAPETEIPVVPANNVSEADILVVAAPAEEQGIPMTPDIRYTVQKNDTLSGIAQVYGVKTAELAKYNGLNVKSIIVPGQVLLIPADMITVKDAKNAADVKYTAPVPAPAPAPAPKKTNLKPVAENSVIHVVKKGEILGRIAPAYGVRAADVAKANSIELNSVLRIGQKLVIPNPTKKPAAVKKADPVKPAEAKKTEPVKKPAEKPAEVKKADPVKPAEKPADAKPADDPLDSLFDTGSSDTAPAPAPQAPAAKPQAKAPAADSIDTFTFTLMAEGSLAETAELMKCSPEEVQRLNPGYGLNDRLKKDTEIILPTVPSY